MKPYTREQLYKDFEKYQIEIDTRHNDDGSLPHKILESEAWMFVCAQEVEARIDSDIQYGIKYEYDESTNIIRYLADTMSGIDSLTFDSENWNYLINYDVDKDVFRKKGA